MATDAGPDPARDRDETEHERLDRNFSELLGELRIALPGVQVLFAFLLVVPFNQRFTELTEFQKDVYFATLLLTAVATILLIAPTAYHRINFRQGVKSEIVFAANSFAIAGIAILALAMCGAILLVTDFLFSGLTAGLVAGISALAFGTVWFAIPVRRRLRDRP